ncbi:MAG: hypothetical protein LUQ33_04855, partial [Methanoregulaceae archaeon]|nr:hypothetical protein [Methanoregulaceae archaeon]
NLQSAPAGRADERPGGSYPLLVYYAASEPTWRDTFQVSEEYQIARIISHQDISSVESRLKMMIRRAWCCQRVDHKYESGSGKLFMAGAEKV